MKPSTTAFAASAFVVSTLAAMFSCASPGPKAALHEIFDQEWETRLAENPMRATSAGRHEWDHLLPSVSAEDHERRAAVSRNFLDRLSQIERAGLDTQDRINCDIFERQLRDSIADFEFGAHEIPINADSGFHISFARLPSRMPFRTARDYENTLLSG